MNESKYNEGDRLEESEELLIEELGNCPWCGEPLETDFGFVISCSNCIFQYSVYPDNEDE